MVGQVGENSTKMCQTSCSTGYAYWDLNICVNICPSIPSLFGYISGSVRICVDKCNSSSTGLYGDVQVNRTCVPICTSTPTATFGENSSSLCVEKCNNPNEYGDPYHPKRYCVSICTSSIQRFSYSVTKLCVATCPDTFYGDNYTTTSVGICANGCPLGYYGDPTTHLCVLKCPFGYYGSSLPGRLCVLKCPNSPIDYFGMNGTTNRVCVSACDTGFWGDKSTRLCYNVKTSCTNNTYADSLKKLCVAAADCTVGTYADPLTKGCSSSCSSSLYFGDSYTSMCTTLCS